MINKELYNYITSEFSKALDKFGTYSFTDKGLNEVMETTALMKRIKTSDIVDVKDTLEALHDSKECKGLLPDLVSDIIVMLDDINDDDWNTLMSSTTLSGLY